MVRSRVETRSLSRDDGTKDVEVVRVPTTLSYGATPDLTLGATIPYVRKEITTRSGGGKSETTLDGLADIFLAGKYRYFERNYPGGSTQLAILGAVKLPTGDTDARDSSGTLLPVSDQLGSGSVDYVGALTATSVFDYDWAAHASVLYKINTEGDRNFQVGNFLNYNLAVSRLIYHEPYPGPEVYIGLELNGEFNARNELNGDDLADSGGNKIFVSPTLVAFLARNWTLEASVQLPVIEDLNGNQPEEGVRFVLGFRFQYATFF